MSSRWYSLTVCLLWLASMTWLVAEKVLPPLMVGDPPNLRQLIAEEREQGRAPVSWQLLWDERALGWATNDTVRRPDDTLELRSRVHLSRFPLRDVAPVWLGPLLEPLGGPDGEPDIDTASRLELTPGGQLIGFYSSLSLGPLKEVIRLRGVVKDKKLQVTVESGDFSYTTSTDVVGDALVGDGLSPRSRLPELHVGQTWTEPIYSPFHPPNNPMQILQATVERDEPIAWNGELVNTWVVVYRNDSGSELIGASSPRGRTWVRRDGTVLKQEVLMLGSRLLFLRLPPGQSAMPAPVDKAASP